jgi:hypothetical protein
MKEEREKTPKGKESKPGRQGAIKRAQEVEHQGEERWQREIGEKQDSELGEARQVELGRERRAEAH